MYFVYVASGRNWAVHCCCG